MSHAAIVCAVCDKVARLPARPQRMPEGWARVTLSNPDRLKKFGATDVVCTAKCACRYVTEQWTGVAA